MVYVELVTDPYRDQKETLALTPSHRNNHREKDGRLAQVLNRESRQLQIH